MLQATEGLQVKAAKLLFECLQLAVQIYNPVNTGLKQQIS